MFWKASSPVGKLLHEIAAKQKTLPEESRKSSCLVEGMDELIPEDIAIPFSESPSRVFSANDKIASTLQRSPIFS
eukprot:15364875-Ditylum_brightwellii.AAC.1